MTGLPTLYDAKPAFQRALLPCVDALAAAGVTPNQITVAALLGSMAVGGGVALGLVSGQPEALVIVGPFLLLRMGMNAIDGVLARRHAQQSALGGILNELGDVLADAALLLPFALLPDQSMVVSALVMLAAVLAAATEIVGLAAHAQGASRRYDGPMGKSDRALVIALLATALAFGVGRAAVFVVFALMDVLLVLTIVERTRRALLEVRS